MIPAIDPLVTRGIIGGINHRFLKGYTMESKLIVFTCLMFLCVCFAGCAFHLDVGTDYHGKTGVDNKLNYRNASEIKKERD